MTTFEADKYERWQVLLASTLRGIAVVRGRRNGRGRWLAAGELPAHVAEYCGCDVQARPAANAPWSTDVAPDLDALRRMLAERTDDRPDIEVRWRERGRVRSGDRHRMCLILHVRRPYVPKLPPRARGKDAIRSIDDLLDFLCADTVREANRRLYKATDCGASLSVYGTYQGRHAAIHNPGDVIDLGWDLKTGRHLGDVPLPEDGSLPPDFVPDSFTIQTIVEGSDATVDGDHFLFGRCTGKQVDAWIQEMESEASYLWRIANLSLFRVEGPGLDEIDVFVECGWGDFEWDEAADVPAEARQAFERWFESDASADVEEGDSVAVGDWRFTRLDRSGEGL